MFTPLAITTFLLAPVATQEDIASLAVQQPQNPTESVPILADIPLLGELFVEQEPTPDPDLRWNGNTEDIYRRAMHLIQVRAKYKEGAELLLSIADTDEVIQVPGQASWVLAQAAVALARAGDVDQAEALLPGIVNGVIGTELDQPVSVLTRRVHALVSAQKEQQPLDDTFRQFLWDRLMEYPRNDKDRGTDILGYGRQTLPYLEEIINGQLKLGSVGHPSDIGQAKKATYFGLRLANDAFVQSLLSTLRSYPPLTARVLLPSSNRYFGEDREAVSANATLYLALAHDADPARSSIAAEKLIYLGRTTGDAKVLEYLWNIATAGDDEVASQLASVVKEGDLYLHEDWAAFILRCAESASPVVREAARWGMVDASHHRGNLRRYAESGNRRDQLRFLVNFTSPPGPDTAMRVRATPIEEQAGIVLASEDYYSELSHPRGGSQVASEDRELIVRLAASPDPGVATVAICAAIDGGDDTLVEEVFLVVDDKQKPKILVSNRKWNYSLETAAQLLAMAAAGSKEAKGWLADSYMPHLSVAELVGSGVAWSQSRRENGWFTFVNDRRSHGDYMAVSDLARVPSISDELRHYALNGTDGDRAAQLAAVASIDLWNPSAASHAEDLYSNAVQSLLRGAERGKGLPADVSPELAERVCEVIWEDIRGGEASMKRTKIEDVLQCHWVSHPERAMALALGLVKNKSDLNLYMETQAAQQGSAKWAQKLCKRWVDAGLWDLEERSAYFLDENEPEFEPLLRMALASNHSRYSALTSLSRVDEKWHAVFADEIAAAWKDPKLAYHVARRFYIGKPEIRDQVSNLLAAWELDGLEDPEILLQAMGETLDARVVPVLLDQLGSANLECRKAAEKGLQRMREVREQREFWEAWEATGSSLSPTVALIQKLKSDNQQVRLAAIQSLGTMKAPEALPFLVELLEDNDAKVQDAAAAALQKINAE